MVVVLFLCVTGAKVKNKNMQKLVKCSVPLVLFVALMLCMSKTVEPYCDPTDVVDALNDKGTGAGPGDTITLTTDGANAVTTAMSVDGVDYGYDDLGTAGGDKLTTIRGIISGGSNVDIIPSDELSNYADCTGDNLKPVLDWACSGGGGSDGANCEEEWPTNRMVWGIVQGEIGATSSGIAYSDITAAAELNSTQCKRAVNTQYCNALTTEVVSAIQSANVSRIAAGRETTDPSVTGGSRSWSCEGTDSNGQSCVTSLVPGTQTHDVARCCANGCDYVSADRTINICDEMDAPPDTGSTGGQSGQSGQSGGAGGGGGTVAINDPCSRDEDCENGNICTQTGVTNPFGGNLLKVCVAPPEVPDASGGGTGGGGGGGTTLRPICTSDSDCTTAGETCITYLNPFGDPDTQRCGTDPNAGGGGGTGGGGGNLSCAPGDPVPTISNGVWNERMFGATGARGRMATLQCDAGANAADPNHNIILCNNNGNWLTPGGDAPLLNPCIH